MITKQLNPVPGKLPFLLTAIFSTVISAAAPPAVHKMEQGQTENRVHLAMIGDGYTESELASLYAVTVDSLMAYMFGHPVKTSPYPRYRNFINRYRIDVASEESGVDDLAGGIYRNTALGGENGCTDFTIKICGVNWEVTHDSIATASAAAGIHPDWFLVLLNDNTYNAAAHYPSRGPLPVYSAHYTGHWDIRDIALHESGHAWHRLADEYFYDDAEHAVYTGNEPGEVNITADPAGAKWDRWLGYEMPSGLTMGVFEGGRYYKTGLYRPSRSSKMNGGPDDCHWTGNDCAHNMVGIEKIILDIYAIVSPFDSHTDNSGTLTNPDEIAVKVVDADVLMIDWSIDGVPVLEKGPERFSIYDHITANGTYEVSARAWDEVIEHAFTENSSPHEMDLVRKDLDKLEQTITWTVAVDDISGMNAGRRNIRANLSVSRSAGREMEVRWTAPLDEHYTLSVADASGRMLGTVAEGTGTGRPHTGRIGRKFGDGVVFVVLRTGQMRLIRTVAIIN